MVDLVNITLGVGLGLLALVVGRFLVALSRDRQDAGDALDITANWTVMLFAGFLGALSTAFVNFGDAAAAVVDVVAQSPLGIAQALTAGLGALALEGFVQLGAAELLAFALAVTGFVLLVSESDMA